MSWCAKRFKRRTRHHNLPRSRKGGDGDNIYILASEHHEAYHKLFGNRTFAEAAEVLRRMEVLHLRRFK